ncbi:MAG: ABC transporter permease, partial [Planctomycetes bacterium]|nr:ABC transporter permease [Planctomycetota bacterium]
SVVSMVSTGEGARRAILSQISELGIRNVIVNAKRPPEKKTVSSEERSFMLRYGLTFDDFEQIQETIPMVEQALPVHDVERWVWFKSRRLQAKVRGVTPDYLPTLQLEPALGRTISEFDMQQRRRVCIVRPRLIRESRYVGDPLELDLQIGSETYRVIGVLPERAFKGANQAILGLDEGSYEIYVPFDTLVERQGFTETVSRSGTFEASRVELHQVVCVIRNTDDVIEGAKCIRAVLQRFHDQQDYDIVVPLELLESRQRTQRVFNIVMPIIAGISLLVGGIGILNIMLASVTERIREIGIRRAIGATRGDITAQFLIETVTLTAIGGLLGVLCGIGGTWVLDAFTDWKPVTTPWAIGLSLAISCATGILFGIYPARRAALMNPIQALRHE